MTDQFNQGWLQRISRRPLKPGLWQGLAGAGLLLALWAGFVLTGRPVTVKVADQAYPVRVHRLAVDAVVRELGLNLAPEDIITPPLGAGLRPGQTVTIELARPVRLTADGRSLVWLSHQKRVAGLLAEAGVETGLRDQLLVDGSPATGQSLLSKSRGAEPVSYEVEGASLALLARTPGRAVGSLRPAPVRVEVRRAIPVTLNDDGVSSTFYTAQPTVAEALREQGVAIYEGDRVMPDLASQLSPGMRLYIQRSIPVTVIADGRITEIRTLEQTVGQLLAQAGLALMGQDYSQPAWEQPISADDQIEVVRVRESFEIDQDFIPFETSWVPDPEMALDRQEVRQPGVTGVIKSRTRVRTENGQELWRGIEDEWLDQEPQDRLIAYGTRITIGTIETEAGPLEYWRKITMLATPYSAATSGKDPDHPRYGITRSGLPAGYGVVAVDPKVIPLMTELYIPGYGRAIAGDTGGLIHGKRIDLGFDEDQPLPEIYEWREVYVLTPVPPADKIRYVLPEWPQRQ